MKDSKKLERHFKGLSNHRRLSILKVVSDNPGITVEGISEKLNSEFANISSHTHKLVNAGLLNKKYIGRSVSHELSPYGKKFLDFIKTL